MQQNNMTSVRELLEQMPTEQLDEMLDAELSKEPADANAVRLILDILKNREKDYPVKITPGVEQAWGTYLQKSSKQRVPVRFNRAHGWILRAASVAAVLILLVSVVPQQAEAESFWEKLARWTDSVFEFFSPGEESTQKEYEFKTDNPGLQQVYDAVTELGVTFPVVPMWLPEGQELIECEIRDVPDKKYMYARFSNGNSVLAFRASIYSSNTPGQYQKDGKQVEQIEQNGTTYNVMRNNERWSVAWAKENVECWITIDCEEDTLYKILKSIYEVEEKQ